MTDSTGLPFGKALTQLVSNSEWVFQLGNPNWQAFARALPTVHYETLRKALTGERPVTPTVMEECAAALGVNPDYFAEYRLWQARRRFDVREVGFEAALRNLDEWGQQRSTPKPRPRRAPSAPGSASTS